MIYFSEGIMYEDELPELTDKECDEWYRKSGIDGGVRVGPIVTKIWEPTNIYGKPIFGKNCSVGAFADIGSPVVGEGVKIGSFCFLPSKVQIKDLSWLGPRVSFTHTFPPAKYEDWEETVIEERVFIGADVTILCGKHINQCATIGAGSVVTHDIPPFEVWVGSPARKLRDMTAWEIEARKKYEVKL